MKVDFYQLTRDPAETILLSLAQKVLDDGGRMLVVSADETQLTSISEALWNAQPDSFLAHAKAVEGDDAVQPILLSTSPIAGNGAKFIAIADGAWRDEALGFERIFYLFLPERTDDARAAWRTLGEREDIERNYWRQEGGRWMKGP